MKNQVRALKVKIKSLAEEARIIRLEEKRALARPRPSPSSLISPYDPHDWTAGGAKKPKPRRVTKYRDEMLYLSMRSHRVKELRQEQRCSLLAYAYIRGVPFAKVERPIKCRSQNPDWSRVRQLIEKFGGTPSAKMVLTEASFREWRAGSPATATAA
jgi:hypothetical protein